jgi:RNA polymerase sigma-70 factor (ECF subfamily)
MSPVLDRIYREEFGRILATLIRLLGDFDIAEDAVQEAFAAAVEQWPRDGMPREPRAWIVSTARHKAIDRLRREGSFSQKRQEILRHLLGEATSDSDRLDDNAVPDDRLRLIFTCCHPALAPEVRIALSLRTLCGLSTEEIARAFLVQPTTIAQRIVRAKRKIRTARIPYEVPSDEALDERLETVMAVIYLVFNEGYAVSFGETLVRGDLCAEAIRLGRILCELLVQHAEARSLLALMLLHDARRPARVDNGGDLVLLEDQDRSLWNRDQIREGLVLVESALRAGPVGPYVIEAAIAGVHARASSPADTDWRDIVALYAYLMRLRPSPVVELNHAVAVAMADGPERGLQLIDSLHARGELSDYHLLWAARADLLRRLKRRVEAAASYREALALARTDPERRFLTRRLAEVESHQ